MSGGSFDYFCYKDEAEKIIAHKESLKEMYEWLRENRKHDAADELEKYYLDLEMFERMIELRHQRLNQILKSAEWWCSGDYGEDTFDNNWKEFLARST